MEDSVLDFLRSALIPELRPDIAAGAPCDIHLRLIAVAAVGAFPHQLARFVRDDLYFAVIAADLTEIALGVEFRVHDIIVNKFHYGKNGGNVVLHIRDFHITDGAAGRKLLKLAFEFKLRESVYRLADVHVIAIGDIVLIRDALDDAEALL